ncbi:MAG: Uma2 family endonuclease [Armatimonadetes bacterium]|nr:Uma2 family endonuclease [Armatimonadota bacterium]
MSVVIEPITRMVQWDEPIDALVRMRTRERARRRRFIDTVREDQKAEFIYGEVVVHSPVTLRHNEVSSRLATLLRAHCQRESLGKVGIEKLMISLSRNDYEPDVCWFGPAKASDLRPDQRRFPAPDFVAEALSPSTEANDRGVKRVDYAAHGVAEYWIIDPEGETVEPLILSGAAYADAPPVRQGDLSSATIPGFRIPVRALFDDKACHAALAALFLEP